MKQRIISLALMVAMLISMLPAITITADAVEYFGECGDGLTWVFDTDTGVLEIGGSGTLDHYKTYNSAPWYGFRTSIKSITIREGVVSISGSVFNGCSNVEDIELPNSINSIGNDYYGYNMFQSFSSLANITIGAENSAYTSLNGVLFNKSMTTLLLCPQKKTGTYTVPDGITSIAKGAFRECNLTEITISNSVKSIEDSAFYSSALLVSLTIGNGVTEIGSSAFGDCVSLESVTIPSSVSAIGSSAFMGCTSLQTAIFENKLTRLSFQLFNSCTSLENVILPNSLTEIDSRAFYGCSGLASITIPNSVKTIGDYAFQNSINLTNITLPYALTTIGVSAFSGCSNLSNLTIPDTVTNISHSAFNDCVGLKSVVLGTGVKALNANVFRGCTNLTDITIPNAITSISYLTFRGCSSLTDINVDLDNGSFVSEEGVLFNKAKTVLVYMPEGKNGPYVIPESVDIVSAYAFYNSSLHCITIPSSVSAIEQYAFNGTKSNGEVPGGFSNITEIYFLGAAPSVGNSSFASTITFYYYEGMSGWTTPTWNSYTTIALEMPEIDEEAPAISITTPPAGGTAGGKVLVISGVATDNRALTKVELSYSLNDGVNFTDIVTLINESVDVRNSFLWSYAFDASSFSSTTMMIKAIAHDGSGNTSEAIATFTLDNTFPDEVKNFEVTGTSRYIFVSWEYNPLPPENDFSNFLVYRATSSDGAFECVSAQKSLGFYDDGENIDAGTTYFYYVSTVDKYGNEGFGSEILSAVLIDDTESPVIEDMLPTNNTVLCNSAIIRVSATDNYRLAKLVLEYKAVSDSEWTEIATITVDEISNNKSFSYIWDVSSISEDTYQVRASVYDVSINDEGVGSGYTANAPSTMIKTVIIKEYAAPVSPVLSVQSGYKSAELNWIYDGDTDLLSSFKVHRSTSENGAYSLVKTVSPSAITHSVEIPIGTTYYYKVEAVDVYATTAISNTISVTSAISDTEPPVAVISPESLVAATDVAFQFSGTSSTDNDVITSYYWEFGDGGTSTSATPVHIYEFTGEYAIKLIVTDSFGNTGIATATMLVVDVAAEGAVYTLTTLSVVDAAVEGTPGIPNAAIYVSSNMFSSTDTTAVTDENGNATVLLRRGNHTVSVVADSYMPRTTSLEILYTESGVDNFTIGMSAVSLLAGELISKEMTYTEIVAAGIDVDDPNNQHVWKFEVILEFTVGFRTFEFPITVGYKNDAEEFKNASGGWFGFPVNDATGKLGIFPMVSEGFYLVIFGEAHWLKEMYNVELLVVNNSYSDEIVDCVAELVLPDGLSLASMLGYEQAAAISLDTIYTASTNYNTQTAKWYVRGDAEGEYYLTANINGEYRNGGISELFSATFTTPTSIKVYAGSALKLTVIADDIAERGEPYNVTLRLTNVSDKPIYNLSFGTTGVEQIKVVSIGNHEGMFPIDSMDFDDATTWQLPKLNPGESAEIELAMEVQFNSVLELLDSFLGYYKPTQALGIFVDVVYYLQNASIVTLEGSTTEIPYEVVVNKTDRPGIIKSVFEPLWKIIKGEEQPQSFVDGLVEMAGFESSTVLSAGTKTVLSLIQGATDYEVRFSLKDAQGNANSYYNDTISITSGTDIQILFDSLNNAYFTTNESGDFTITGLKAGETILNITVKGDNLNLNYTIPIIVNDKKVETKIKLSQDLATGDFKIDTDVWKYIIEEVQKTEGETFEENPYLWFASYLKLDICGNAGGLESVLSLDNEKLSELIAKTVISSLNLDSDIADLNIDKETLSAVLAASSEDEAIKIAIKKLGEGVAEEMFGVDAPTYEFLIEVGNDIVSEFNGGEVGVSIPYRLQDGANTDNIEVHRIKDYDTYEIVPSEYDSAEGLVNFSTGEFSYYRIVYVDKVRPTGTPLITGILAYGQKLSSLPISVTMVDGSGNEVGGTITWQMPDSVPVVGASAQSWVFIPADDTLYSSVNGTAVITVNKSVPSGTPTYENIATTGKTLADANLNGTFVNRYNSEAVPGTLEWIDSDSASVTINRSYIWTFVPSDTNNYEATSGSIILYVSGGGASSGGSGGSSSDISTEVGGTTVTTPLNQKPVENEDGSISLLGGGMIEVGNNDSTVIVDAPAGTIVDRSGEVTIPNGEEAKLTLLEAGATATVPGGTTISTDGIVFIGDGTAVVSLPNNNNVSLPKGSTIQGNTISVGADGAIVTVGSDTYTFNEGEVIILDSEVPLGFYVAFQSPFDDVNESDWFYDAVKYVCEHGIMQGAGTDGFEPNVKLTRSMMVQILYNLEKQPSVNGAGFGDVASGMWYSDAIGWASENNITHGLGNGLFAPANEITREQMAVMLYNYCVFKGIKLPVIRETANFVDGGSVSAWAAEAVEAMYKAGVLSGKGDGIFAPQDTATRAEVAQMFMNFLEAIK